tara:strand:- start:179 stop:1333 length:1155 start_codon:yes stop_codon:yes gene_type:complete
MFYCIFKNLKKLVIILLFFPLIIFGQNFIKGVVLDDRESPLPFAFIINKANNKQVVSDNIGKFKIKGAIGDTLKISFVGFNTVILKTSSKNSIVKLFMSELQQIQTLNNVKVSSSETSFLNCEINNKECYQKNLDNHIRENFYYPSLGDYFNIQAMVYVNYTIDNTGSVKDIKSNAALIGVNFADTESKEIVSGVFEKAASSMFENLPKMNPVIVDGVGVDTKFRSPVLYKLSDLGSYSEENISKLPIVLISIKKIEKALKFLNNNSLTSDMAIIEDVPLFPGCERVPKSERRNCFQEQIQKHIIKNFRYPKIAQQAGIQGRVFVQFMIGKDGNINGIRTRGPDKNLEKEAKRIISKLPKMTSGKQKGRPVRVPFSIPITFKLN